MHSRLAPVELGRFSGYNAEDWVLQAELYFDFYAISDAHKFNYVSSYFDGDALVWFHWMYHNNQLVDWKYFKEQVVMRFPNKVITAPKWCLIDPSQALFDYVSSAPSVPPVTHVFSIANMSNIPTYCAFESTSRVGNSNAEQMFDEMPQTEDSPFSLDNEVFVSTEGYATTTEPHLLDECSQQPNHKVFLNEHSDATIFNPERHSALEDEKSEEVCDVQAEFEGSMNTVQETLVANDQGFVLPKDFAPMLATVQLNVPVSTNGSLSKCASNSISHSSCLFTNFNTFAPSYGTGRHHVYELSDAWVDTGQLSDSLSYVSETLHRFYNKLGMYPYVWYRSSQQLFDNMSQTCDCSKVFADNTQGDAIGMLCQFDLVKSITGSPIIASYFIPSMFKGVTLILDNSILWCLSFNAYHVIPTMKFGKNQVAVIANKSLVFILEFEEAFDLNFSIFRSYDCSASCHCIPKSKAMSLILHVSDVQDNAFMELLVVDYARVHVELDMNFVLSVSHNTPKFFQLNTIGQVPLLDTLDRYVGENKAIACYVTLWHHQSIPTCFQVESRSTLAYLAENIGHFMHINCSDNLEDLSDMILENLWDTALNQMCSILDDPVSRVQLAPASPLLLLNNNQCISLVRAVCLFLRDELKFPTHLLVQVQGSHLAKVNFPKRISKYDMMKLVTEFEELIMSWCDNLQVPWFGCFSLDLFIHNIVIHLYVQRCWLNYKRRLFSALIAFDVIATLGRALINFAAHTCENDSWTQSMIESELSICHTEDTLILPCMLPLDLATHSLEFGTRWKVESSAFMLPTLGSKSSLFPCDGFDFFLIVIAPITIGFSNGESSSSTCRIKWFRFQSTGISACLMIQDVNVAQHKLAARVPKDEVKGEMNNVRLAVQASGMSQVLHLLNYSFLLSRIIVIFINHVRSKLSTVGGFGDFSDINCPRYALVNPLDANLFSWLVDQMLRSIALSLETSGQDTIWDPSTDGDKKDNHMIFVLLYTNLEDKVLFGGRSNVMNIATVEDPIGLLLNYVWDPG